MDSFWYLILFVVGLELLVERVRVVIVEFFFNF